MVGWGIINELKMLYWTLKILLGPVLRGIWIKKAQGIENFPKKGAFIVAANHSSYFDFLSLIAVCPRQISFLAAEKFFKSWFWWPIVAGTGQIKVERQSQNKEEVYKKVFYLLKNGKVLGIFPEGTRSTDGKIGKTYTGVAKFALQAKVPVVPVGITGTFEVLSRHDKTPKFKKSININVGKPMTFEQYYSQANNDSIVRQITDEIINNIESLKIKP